jgi:sulfonate transport system permease protein
MKKGGRVNIYKTGWHLLITFIIIILPFFLLLLLAKISGFEIINLYENFGISLYRIAIAYVIALILGWIFAVLFYKGKGAVIALPIFDVLQSFPTFAALPLAVYFFGQTNLTVILFLVLTIIWPLFFSILSSLKLIREDWEDAVEIAKLSKFNYLKKFILPVSIPGLITGSIVGLGEGWEALVATEIIVNVKEGMGFFFKSFSTNIPVTILGILGFLIIIYAINKLVWIPLLDRSHRMMGE